jgi:hypothetical protein
MRKVAEFPVSREFAWRGVRSALRRQGGSLVRTGHYRRFLHEFSHFGDVYNFLASGAKGEAAKDG